MSYGLFGPHAYRRLHVNYILPFAAYGFPAWARLGAAGTLAVTDDELIWAAATLGDRKRSRPWSATLGASMEMRVATLRSAFVTPCAFCLTASHTYTHELDDSEKRYVSYLLGGVSARLFASRFFGAPYLVHYDAVLRASGRPVAGRRPDFVGVGIPPLSARIIVEAKGTLGPSRSAVLRDAAEKAKSARAAARRRPRRLAWGHEAHFEGAMGGGFWGASLLDPPTDDLQFPELGELLLGYYLPLAVDLMDGEVTRVAGSGTSNWYARDIGDQGVQVAMRQDIVEAAIARRASTLVEICGLEVSEPVTEEDGAAAETVSRVSSAPDQRPLWSRGDNFSSPGHVGHDGIAVRKLVG